MKRTGLWVMAQGCVTVALLALLFRALEIDVLVTLFRSLPATFYVTSLAVVLAGQVAYAWRWRLLLAAAGTPVRMMSILKQYFVGLFVNNFLPSTVGGDAYKVYDLGRSHGYRVVTASIVIDRLLGLALLASLASVALWVGPVADPTLAAAAVATTAIAVAALGLLVLTGMGTGGLPERVGRLGEQAVALAERLQRLRKEMAAPLVSPMVVTKAAVVVVAYAAANAFLYVWFIGLHGAPAPSFLRTFAVVAAIAVLSNIPISLNGLGLREQLHASLLLPLGVPREIAVAMSLLLYAHLLVASLLGFMFWLKAPPASGDIVQAS